MTAGLPEAPAPVLVLALGNLLLSDDGLGLEILERLRSDAWSQEIEFADGGTQGLSLLALLGGRRAVLILDAVQMGAAPGTVHVLNQSQMDDLGVRRSSSAHEGNAKELLAAARLLGDFPEHTVILGIEPESIHTGIGLSDAVSRALPEAIERARNILAEFTSL